MSTSIKSKVPLLFLITVSIWWAFYYQGNSGLNDFGNANFEWLYFLDALVVLPILCFFCIKNKKDARLKAIILCCLAILIGSYIVPEQNKLVWHYLESGRYVVLAVVLLFEIGAILTVYLAIRSSLHRQSDPDLSIEKSIKRFLGEGPVTQLLSFETRMWTYALFAGRIKPDNFSGEQYFSYHQKDGTQSNLLGFVLLIAFEMPLMHLILYFIWSPLAANILTLLTLFSLAFFIAEYRAVSRRPISLLSNKLIVRYGLYQPMVIPLTNVRKIIKCNEFVKRAKFVKRFNYSGSPNVVIELVEPKGAIKNVYIGVDQPELFISAIQNGKIDEDICKEHP